MLYAQEIIQKAPDPPVDLEHQKTLYVVGYAHLDTQWRWSYPQVIREFIRHTMEDNFPLFEKYPDYIFNFTGSRRYEFMEEYYPDDFARVRQYVAAGRWFPAGAEVDEGDTLISGLESRVRHVLYSNRFFEREFHKESDEVMLPDSFGFPACLPSILAHCGIKGFSTQKLTWGSAVGIPFNLGIWQGVDGQKVVAALNPGPYDSGIDSDLSNDANWISRVQDDGDSSGVYADFRYYGTGDRGGAASENSVRWLERSLAPNGPLRIISAPANRIFNDLTDDEKTRLPVYQGELLLTGHSTGCLTSKAIMKRFNRKNELLANVAESAATAAYALGALPYPGDKLYRAWDIMLGSQMHDMLPGTCIPQAYNFTWNDEVLVSNEFAAVAENSAAAVIAGMDTQAGRDAVPIVVYNPLSIAREDVVEASITLPAASGSAITVFGPDGSPTPTQVESIDGNRVKILFLAKAPPVGYAVYQARPVATASPASPLKISANQIENERYRVTLDRNGDVASIFDKTAGRELLANPAQLVFQREKPRAFPSWNMDWSDRRRPPEAVVAGPARISVAEAGPVRVSLRVTRSALGSNFTQQIRLSAGAAGNRVEFATDIDWRSLECSLKASFPLAVSNPLATYDAQLGTVQRGNNNPKKFEVPQYQWMDLTNTDGSYGVSILNDCKYGSDKPDDSTMRLTLLYSPGVWNTSQDQGTQDIGRQKMLYAVEGHQGDWRDGDTTWEAARLNQPLIAFVSTPHAGPLGKTFSFFATSTSQVQIVSIKKAEDSGEIVVRMRELLGKQASAVRLSSQLPLVAAREINGQEKPVGPANVKDGALEFDISPYQLRAFALRLAAPPQSPVAAVSSRPLDLSYDLNGVSPVNNLEAGNFDGQGHTYPAEQFPATVVSDGVFFQFGPAQGGKNALTCHGQSIELPDGSFNRAYILAAAIDGDQQCEVSVDGIASKLTVQDWSQFIGQWDNRLWQGVPPELNYNWDNALDGLVPGYVKPAPVAWYCSHRHDARQGNEFYQYAYIFKYGIDLPLGAKQLTLPNNGKIRIFAISLANEPEAGIAAASPLYDTFDDHVAGGPPDASPAPGKYPDMVAVTLAPPLYNRVGHLHYTTDGSDPTPASPVYTDKLVLSRDTVVKACECDDQTRPGKIWTGRYEIEDVSPPRVTGISSVPFTSDAEVDYSKPVEPQSALDVTHYIFSTGGGAQTRQIRITSADLSRDGMTVTLHLGSPLPMDTPVGLDVRDITENSARANVLKSFDGQVTGLQPVYSLASLDTPRERLFEDDSALPVQPGEPWTLNMFLRCDQPPQGDGVLLGGWGCAQDSASRPGTGRYFIKFTGGIAFWLANEDLRTNVPIDAGRWQMLTATYDGKTITLYKDGGQIASSNSPLAPDDQTVAIGIADPWGRGNKFEGEIRNFQIWRSALGPDAVKALLQTGPGN